MTGDQIKIHRAGTTIEKNKVHFEKEGNGSQHNKLIRKKGSLSPLSLERERGGGIFLVILIGGREVITFCTS